MVSQYSEYFHHAKEVTSMYVGRIMHSYLVTVPPDTTIIKAKDIVAKKRINHLLVVDKNEELVGIVSDRDIKQSWASPATTLSTHELNYLLTQLTVEMIMVKKDRYHTAKHNH
jgi:acetoin utilization protein AcuB